MEHLSPGPKWLFILQPLHPHSNFSFFLFLLCAHLSSPAGDAEPKCVTGLVFWAHTTWSSGLLILTMSTWDVNTIGQWSSASRIWCLMIWGGANIIIIQIRWTINETHLNHPETIPPQMVHGKIILDKTSPQRWKGWELLCSPQKMGS